MKIKNILRRLIFKKKNIKELLIKNGAKIGKNIFIGADCSFDMDWAFLLEIDDGSVIASRTMIQLHDSCLPNVRGKGKLRVGKVIIEKMVYIGVNSTILPGVKIGEGSIIGANTLVNKNIPANEVWAGVPVRYICTVDELIEKRKKNKELIFDIEFIGEAEKKKVDYLKYKKKKIEEIRKMI